MDFCNLQSGDKRKLIVLRQKHVFSFDQFGCFDEMLVDAFRMPGAAGDRFGVAVRVKFGSAFSQSSCSIKSLKDEISQHLLVPDLLTKLSMDLNVWGKNETVSTGIVTAVSSDLLYYAVKITPNLFEELQVNDGSKHKEGIFEDYDSVSILEVGKVKQTHNIISVESSDDDEPFIVPLICSLRLDQSQRFHPFLRFNISSSEFDSDRVTRKIAYVNVSLPLQADAFFDPYQMKNYLPGLTWSLRKTDLIELEAALSSKTSQSMELSYVLKPTDFAEKRYVSIPFHMRYQRAIINATEQSKQKSHIPVQITWPHAEYTFEDGERRPEIDVLQTMQLAHNYGSKFESFQIDVPFANVTPFEYNVVYYGTYLSIFAAAFILCLVIWKYRPDKGPVKGQEVPETSTTKPLRSSGRPKRESKKNK